MHQDGRPRPWNDGISAGMQFATASCTICEGVDRLSMSFATMGLHARVVAVEVPRQRAHQDDHAAAHVVVGRTSRPPRRVV